MSYLDKQKLYAFALYPWQELLALGGHAGLQPSRPPVRDHPGHLGGVTGTSSTSVRQNRQRICCVRWSEFRGIENPFRGMDFQPKSFRTAIPRNEGGIPRNPPDSAECAQKRETLQGGSDPNMNSWGTCSILNDHCRTDSPTCPA